MRLARPEDVPSHPFIEIRQRPGAWIERAADIDDEIRVGADERQISLVGLFQKRAVTVSGLHDVVI